ncbi:hypothetical protein [Streptomyces sp. WMMC897]|uniref:hypothetical protein n=1 Tax=Streptomyces sp. WMMC897 TaxID=3014782 RepID=UPI0022B60648|nr:hypothetical protein [Streptomyces sp. WMMC897]MCZ7414321.1 hypothetical protein [Streptomyces sp. WMMC897]
MPEYLAELITSSGVHVITSDTLEATGARITRGRPNQASAVSPSKGELRLLNVDGRYSRLNPMSDLYGQLGPQTLCGIWARGTASYVRCGQTAGHRAYVADTTALDITQDLDVAVEMALFRLPAQRADYAHEFQEIAGRYVITGDQRSWRLLITSWGQVELSWSDDGTFGGFASATSTVALPVRPAQRVAIRATLDVDNGDGGHTARFWYAPSISAAAADGWAPLGAPVTGAGTTGIFNASAPLELGDLAELGLVPGLGLYSRMHLRDGIGGPLLVDMDARELTPGTTSWVDDTGLTWTLEGGALVSTWYPRLIGTVPRWPVQWQPGGPAETPIQVWGPLRALAQGQPALPSTLRRRIPSADPAPLAYWPMEGGRDASEAASGLSAGAPLTLTGVQWAADDSLGGAAALPTLGTSARLYGTVSGATAGGWHAEMVYRLDELPATEQTVLRLWLSGASGGARSVRVRVSTSGVRIQALDEDNGIVANVLHTDPDALADFAGSWNRLAIFSFQDGGTCRISAAWRNVSEVSYWYVTTSWTGTTVGRITAAQGAWGADWQGAAIGHLAVWDVGGTSTTTPGITIYDGADDGYAGELAADRMRRLAQEEQRHLGVLGEPEPQQRVGPQGQDSYLALVQEAADADGGLLYEQRWAAETLAYMPRSALYNRAPAMVLDYTEGVLADGTEPQDDDRDIRNLVTVTRRDGGSATAELTEGPRGTQPPPDGLGPRPDTPTLNLHSDDQTEPIAWWRLHLGTAAGSYRWPKVVLNLRNPRLANRVQEYLDYVDVGAVLRLTNLPVWTAPGDVDLVVENVVEHISTTRWTVELTCSPAEPWTAGVVVGETAVQEDFEDTTYTLTITDAGDAAWARDNTQAHSGSWSLRSGTITDNQTTDAVVSLPPDAQTLTFWYMTSSEEAGPGFTGDFLSVHVDGTEVLRAQGETAWTQHELDVRGAAEVTFRYSKDNSASSGSDAAWIDDLTVTVADDAGPASPNRVDTDGSELASDATAAATTIDVHTPAPGVPWMTGGAPLNGNGDFEADLTGWTGNGGTITRVATPTPAYPNAGSWSLEFTPDGVAEFPNAGSDLVPVVVGASYTLSGWVRCATSRNAALNINWFDGTGTYLSTSSNDKAVVADQWTYFTITATAPAGAASANAAATVPNFPPGTDVLWADEVFLRPAVVGGRPTEFPFDVRAGGEVLRVRGIEPLGHDAFTRVETATWGTADSGQTWAAAGTASDFAVDGAAGTITLTSPVETIRRQALPEDIADCEVLVRMSVDQVATGASMIPGILLRESGLDYYRARLHFGTGGTMFVSVAEDGSTVGGTTTLPYTYVVDQWFWLRARITGQTVQVKAWPDGQREPTAWQHEVEITTVVIASGAIGVTGSAFSNNTNTNPTISYDNFEVITPQRMTVTRSINGVTKAHDAGADVRLAQPAIVAL